MLVIASILVSAIVLNERDNAVMVVMTPRGVAPATRTAELIEAAAAATEARTSLALLSPEQAGADLSRLDACEERDRLSCWVRAVRGDYDRLSLELPNGEVRPYEDHQDDLARRSVGYVRYLFAVSVFPQSDGGERVTALLIDTDRALAEFHHARRETKGWNERVENRIFEQAVRAPPGVLGDSADESLRAYFVGALSGPFRAAFERSGHWEPYGRVEITAQPKLTVELDGKVVGQTESGVTAIERVTPGTRALRVSHPEGTHAPFTDDLIVGRKGTVAREISLIRLPSTSVKAARLTTLWGGVALAAAGAALTAYGLAADPNLEYSQPCLQGECGTVGSKSFVSFCDLSAETSEDCAGSGLLIGPLGYSLVATGATWSLGTALFVEDGEFPWIPLVAGVVAGGLSYGLSAALGGGGPP